MYYETIREFKKAYGELDIVLYMSLFTLLMPVSILCKYIFSRITDKTFVVTVSNICDCITSILVVFIWSMTIYYRGKDPEEILFSPE